MKPVPRPLAASLQAVGSPSDQKPLHAWLAYGFSLLAFLIGVSGCLGYLLNLPILLTYFPLEPPIALLTTVSMVFLGIGAFLVLNPTWYRQSPAGIKIMYWGALALPGVIGLACLIYYINLARLNLGHVMFLGREGPLIPTVMTSSRIFLASIALLLLHMNQPRNALMDYSLCGLGLYLIYTSLFAMTGHVLHLPLLFNYMVSVPASLGFILLGVTILLATIPYHGLISTLLSPDKTTKNMSIATLLLSLAILVYGTVTIANSLTFMTPLNLSIRGTHMFITAELTTVLIAILVELIAAQAIYYRSEAQIHAAKETQVLAALTKSEKRFRNLAETSTALIWETNEDGKVIYWNPKLLEFVGHATTNGDRYWDWTNFVRPEEVPAIHQKLIEVGQTGQQYDLEVELWHAASGQYRWIKSSGKPVYGNDGEFLGIVGISIDVHDLKQAQANLQKIATQLYQSNQDLEQFAAVASHDLKAPLRKISIFSSQIATEREHLSPESQDALDRILRSIEGMESLIEDLLAWSQVSHATIAFEPVNLADVVAHVLLNLKTTVQDTNAKINLGALREVVGDRVQLEQLFQNLLENALKYQPSGHTPEIWVEATELSEQACQITVRDNGIGFKQEYAERIFQPFERLHGKASPYSGSGVGLAICQRIVERHGGTIMAQSAEGQGATFLVTLPVQNKVPTVPPVASAGAPQG